MNAETSTSSQRGRPRGLSAAAPFALVVTRRRGRTFALFALALLARPRAPATPLPADPASDLVRVRAFLTTAASSTELTVEGAEWANVVSPDPAVRAIIDGQTVHLTRRASGDADVQLDIILASVRARTRVAWTITPFTGESAFEVFNLNGAAPRAVDRFTAGGGGERFASSADLLRADGPLPAIPRVQSRLVLAFFYPWFARDSWSRESTISDAPVQPYSTDEAGDLQRLMTTAAKTGLDAFVMSWSGRDFNGRIDHGRMLRCLDAARKSGFRMAVLFETTVANRDHVDGNADPDTVFEWLADVVDEYAGDPAYLRVNGRPVVMAYAAQRLSATRRYGDLYLTLTKWSSDLFRRLNQPAVPRRGGVVH